MVFSFCLGYATRLHTLGKRWTKRKNMLEWIQIRIKAMVDVISMSTDMIFLKEDINAKLWRNALSTMTAQQHVAEASVQMRNAMQDYKKCSTGDANRRMEITKRIAQWHTLLAKHQTLEQRYKERHKRLQHLTLTIEKCLKEKMPLRLKHECKQFCSRTRFFIEFTE